MHASDRYGFSKISKVSCWAACSADIINPVLGLIMGKVGDLSQAYLEIGSAELMWGNFVSVLIDFLVVAFVVYFVFKKLGIEKLDKK